MAAAEGSEEFNDEVSGMSSAGMGPRATIGVLEPGSGMGIFVLKGVEVIGISEMCCSGVGRVSTGLVSTHAIFCGCGGVMS